MLKIIVLVVSAFLFGCAHQGIETVPVELFKGVAIEFPASNLSHVDALDIGFYSENKYLGYVQKEFLPKEEQPAVDFIRIALELTKKKKWKIKEVSRDHLVGYVVYLEGTSTMHLASTLDKETVLTISTSDEKVEEILSTLKTIQ